MLETGEKIIQNLDTRILMELNVSLKKQLLLLYLFHQILF